MFAAVLPILQRRAAAAAGMVPSGSSTTMTFRCHLPITPEAQHKSQRSSCCVSTAVLNVCCCGALCAEARSCSRWYGPQRPQLPAAVGGCQQHNCNFLLPLSYHPRSKPSVLAVTLLCNYFKVVCFCCRGALFAEARSRSRWYGPQRPQLPAAVGGCQQHNYEPSITQQAQDTS
jgi:hypothetical protein